MSTSRSPARAGSAGPKSLQRPSSSMSLLGHTPRQGQTIELFDNETQSWVRGRITSYLPQLDRIGVELENGVRQLLWKDRSPYRYVDDGLGGTSSSFHGVSHGDDDFDEYARTFVDDEDDGELLDYIDGQGQVSWASASGAGGASRPASGSRAPPPAPPPQPAYPDQRSYAGGFVRSDDASERITAFVLRELASLNEAEGSSTRRPARAAGAGADGIGLLSCQVLRARGLPGMLARYHEANGDGDGGVEEAAKRRLCVRVCVVQPSADVETSVRTALAAEEPLGVTRVHVPAKVNPYQCRRNPLYRTPGFEAGLVDDSGAGQGGGSVGSLVWQDTIAVCLLADTSNGGAAAKAAAAAAVSMPASPATGVEGGGRAFDADAAAAAAARAGAPKLPSLVDASLIRNGVCAQLDWWFLCGYLLFQVLEEVPAPPQSDDAAAAASADPSAQVSHVVVAQGLLRVCDIFAGAFRPYDATASPLHQQVHGPGGHPNARTWGNGASAGDAESAAQEFNLAMWLPIQSTKPPGAGGSPGGRPATGSLCISASVVLPHNVRVPAVFVADEEVLVPPLPVAHSPAVAARGRAHPDTPTSASRHRPASSSSRPGSRPSSAQSHRSQSRTERADRAAAALANSPYLARPSSAGGRSGRPGSARTPGGASSGGFNATGASHFPVEAPTRGRTLSRPGSSASLTGRPLTPGRLGVSPSRASSAGPARPASVVGTRSPSLTRLGIRTSASRPVSADPGSRSLSASRSRLSLSRPMSARSLPLGGSSSFYGGGGAPVAGSGGPDDPLNDPIICGRGTDPAHAIGAIDLPEHVNVHDLESVRAHVIMLGQAASGLEAVLARERVLMSRAKADLAKGRRLLTVVATRPSPMATAAKGQSAVLRSTVLTGDTSALSLLQGDDLPVLQRQVAELQSRLRTMLDPELNPAMKRFKMVPHDKRPYPPMKPPHEDLRALRLANQAAKGRIEALAELIRREEHLIEQAREQRELEAREAEAARRRELGGAGKAVTIGPSSPMGSAPPPGLS